MKIHLAAVAFLIFSGSSYMFCQKGNAAFLQGTVKSKTKQQRYDGRWWLAASSDERSGYLYGAGDCLTWVAHAKWLSYSLQGLDMQITEYYNGHPEDVSLTVTDVWRKLLARSRPPEASPGGEAWTNPHGYLDGTWWVQTSEAKNLGFLEGYLWCLGTSVTQPSETYSRSITYYSDKISEYIQTHPKTAYNEAIADILSRFRDHR